MRNQIAQYVGIQEIKMVDCPMPTLKDDEVVIKMEYVGICGSDMHFYKDGRSGQNVIKRPFILGHECAGIVTEVGAAVTDLEVGMRVALEPGVPCGCCEFCKNGKYNLCPSVQFLSAYPCDGALRRFMSYPARFCFKLPDHISSLEGSMIEPLAIGIHAARRGGVKNGQCVVILGSGLIGLMIMMACRAMGASQIIVVDLFEKRLENAKKFGADVVVNAKCQELSSVLQEKTNGLGADIVFEAAGTKATMVQTADIVKRGGVIVPVGNVVEETPYPFFTILKKEADIRPIFRYRHVYPQAIQWLSDGVINLKALEPVIFPFSETQRAFQYAMNYPQEYLKTVISFKDEDIVVCSSD